MRGKRAKEIMLRSRNLLLSLGVSPAEGYGKYRQAKNCHTFKPLVIDNKIIRNDDGTTVMIPSLTYGTVHSEDRLRLFYRWLKKIYKDPRVDTDTVLGSVAGMLRKQYHDEQKASLAKAEAAEEAKHE